ncbi:hypothetical protein [Hypericibacter sp.]|uniref:hypothetical protein n=1 Tax=Hypericibacter sp. TaxID=2705401 RepID=UPI003D6CF74A
MTAKLRTRGTLRTPWNRTPTRRNPTPATGRENPEPAKSDLRQGGLEHDGKDPLRHVPLKEPYAAKSGANPAETGTPATVTTVKKKEG